MKISFFIQPAEFHLWPTDTTMQFPREMPQVGDAIAAGGTYWKVVGRIFVLHGAQQVLSLHLHHAPEMDAVLKPGREVASLH